VSHFSDFQQPGHSFDPHPAPRRSSSPVALILAIIGGIGAASFLACCGGFVALAYFGKTVSEQELADQLRDNPALQEHIGDIEQLSLNFIATAAIEDEDIEVYDVQGTKGKGKITVKTSSLMDADDEIIWAKLRLDSGETVELISEYAENPGS
jgi:hypothetical protein